MIPNVVRKKEIKENWFPGYPVRDIHKAIQQASYDYGRNSKYRRTMVKQEIIYVIKELGLPERFTIVDWYDYLDDPLIRNPSSEGSSNVINVDL